MSDAYDEEFGVIRIAEKVEKEPDEFFDLINPSQREHLQKPEGFSKDKERYLKSWDELSAEEQKETEAHMKQRYEDVEGKVNIKMIEEWRKSIDSILFHHFLDPDDWWVPESWELANKEWEEYSQEELDEVIGTFSFRHGGVDVKHLLKGKGVFYKRPPSDNHFKLVEFKKKLLGMGKKEELKAKLAAIGINFDDDTSKVTSYTQPIHREHPKTPLKKEVPFGKPLKKLPREFDRERKLQTEGTHRDIMARPPKPTNRDFNRIISAARQKIAEKRMDIDHKHRIEYFNIGKGSQRTAQLVESGDGKYVKYWILNAKQVNGNHWGVSPDTIEDNIQNFVDMPFVITAKTWIPESEYGDSYEHPYLPTNNLNFIYAHQDKFAVGTIRKIIKEHDDYYAMIEMKPKYAHLVPPPFCSPGIFQVDRNEPMDKISKWLPLHLAGLMEDPAYGASVALLKGTCMGTENECFVQFRGAKLEIITVCPFNSLRDKIKQKKAQAEGENNVFNMTYDKSKPTKVKKKILKAKLQRLAIAEIGKPYKRPEYGRDDFPLQILDKVDDDVQEHGHKIGHQLLEHSALSEQGLPKVAGTFNWMLKEIHLQNHNNFGPNFEGVSGDKSYEGLDSSKKSLTDMAHGFHKEDFGMNEERRRPEGKGEELGEALFEPFRRQKDEEIAANPRRTEDFVEGKKLINKFSDELYGHMGERINFHSQNLSAKKQGILKARLNKLHENNRNKYADDFNRSAKNVRATMGRGSTQVAAESTVNDDIQIFKRVPELDYKTGFTYDPRLRKLLSSNEARRVYGKAGLDMHFIARTNNAEGADKISTQLNQIKKEGIPHFIGGYHSNKLNQDMTDASYILHTNDENEVKSHLKKYLQEESYSIKPDGRTYSIHT